MANILYSIQKRRQKIYIRIYAALCVIVLLSMGFYSYQKFQQYSISKEAVAKNHELVNVLRDQSTEEKSLFDSEKKDSDKLNKEINEKIKYIFPTSDQYIVLTHQLDAFEDELATLNSPFEVSSIDYQTTDTNENYSILPFRMNIRSSPENFTKFLHMVENSGSLNDQIRLMDVSSITLNFEESGRESEMELQKSEIINFTVQINAYFQKI